MVDPYQNQGARLDKSDASQEEHDDNFNFVRALISDHNKAKSGKPLAQLFRDFSLDAAQNLPMDTKGFRHVASLDFVYIDARHDYRSVAADLNAWYPLVKAGGIIAGHDYKNSFVRKNLVEVKRAVDAFFFNAQDVLTTTEDNLPSWYVLKQ